MNKSPTIGLLLALAVLLAANFISLNAATTPPNLDQRDPILPFQFGEPKCIPFLTDLEIRNPEIATRYGIDGYVEVVLADDTPTTMIIENGGQRSIPLQLTFVSYNSSITETKITIDPHNDDGLLIEACYVLCTDEGDVYSRGTINVNELISYDPTGQLLVPSGQTVSITLTITIPRNFPGGVEFLPIGPIGIATSFPLIGVWMVKVYP